MVIMMHRNSGSRRGMEAQPLANQQAASGHSSPVFFFWRGPVPSILSRGGTVRIAEDRLECFANCGGMRAVPKRERVDAQCRHMRFGRCR
jgi:hypothetical protein